MGQRMQTQTSELAVRLCICSGGRLAIPAKAPRALVETLTIYSSNITPLSADMIWVRILQQFAESSFRRIVCALFLSTVYVVIPATHAAILARESPSKISCLYFAFFRCRQRTRWHPITCAQYTTVVAVVTYAQLTSNINGSDL